MSTNTRSGRRGIMFAVAAVAAVLAFSTIAVPTFLAQRAAASWTPVPASLAAEDRTSAAAACREHLNAPPARDDLVLAERRGDWDAVLVVEPRAQAVCVMNHDLVDRSGDDLDGFIDGWATQTDSPPRLAPDGFEVGASSGAQTDVGQIDYVSGYVGRDVTEVSVFHPSGDDVEATVAGGRFLVWFLDAENPATDPFDTYTYTYTVTLADGTSRDIDPSTLDGA